MDEFMGEFGSRLKVSITDSTMMCIVHDAMDRAHGKVKSRGVIARLSEMSRFYELAVIQLEGCLRFVEEEADALGFDSGHQDLIVNLAEIRNHLLGRLEESEMAISDKDRELMERTESEWRLRQALEMKERELDSLRSNKFGEDAAIDDDAIKEQVDQLEFSELKNSVDQQVSNLGLGPMYGDKIDNERIECMGLDISNLKETLDLAFGKMQNAIFSSETALGPGDQQWRRFVENDITADVIRGFIRDVRESFEAEITDLYEEVDKFKQENEEMKARERISGGIYVEILRGIKDEFCTELFDLESEIRVREGVVHSIVKETIIENESAMKSYTDESFIAEKIRRSVYKETIRSIVICARNTELDRKEDDVSNIGTDSTENEHSSSDRSSNDQNCAIAVKDEIGKAVLEEFSEVISNFEQSICNYIEKNHKRLDNMKNRVDWISGRTGLLRKRESVYEKAFIRRCQNMQKAEAEVDLLADQVDMLNGLLEKIYMKLGRHSAVLEQNSEVSEILKLIENEFGVRKI